MLVTRTRSRFLSRLRRDAGSTLVTVLIVMLVLTIGGITLSTIVLSTAGTVVNTRDRSAAQAEIDGVITAKSVDLMAGRLTCNTSAVTTGQATNGTSTVPVDWSLSCEETGAVGTATISAEASVGGERAKHSAVYSYQIAPAQPGYGDMTFFGNTVVTFTEQVHPGSPEKPITLVVPNAGFECMTEIWGSVVVRDNIEIKSSACKVHGDLISVQGVVRGNQADAVVDGNITTGGTQTNVIYGTVGGSVHTKGGIDFSWSNRTISGSVVTGGNVELRQSRILGSLTTSTTATVKKSSGSFGSHIKLSTVPEPTLPHLPTWFEFQYKPAEWPGFTNVITLSPSLPSGNPLSCAYYNSWPQKGWPELASIPTNTVLDGRACDRLSTNAGTSPVVKLPHDLLILMKKFDSTTSTWMAAPGTTQKPSVWFVVEDPNPADHAPSCTAGAGDLALNHAGATTTIKAMAYTPCTIRIQGGSTFNGQLYSAGWSYGGGITFLPDEIALPGMSSGNPGEAGPGGSGGPIAGSFVLQSSQDERVS